MSGFFLPETKLSYFKNLKSLPSNKIRLFFLAPIQENPEPQGVNCWRYLFHITVTFTYRLNSSDGFTYN